MILNGLSKIHSGQLISVGNPPTFDNKGTNTWLNFGTSINVAYPPSISENDIINKIINH